MGQISVYLNPNASNALKHFHAEKIKKYFWGHQIHLKTPSSHTEFLEMVQLDKERKVECIFSIGGDGTAHSIAQHLIGSQTKLLVLPGGTANDFASELGTNSTLKQLANLFESKNTKRVDALMINDKIMMTNGGIGIASDVALEVNRLRGLYPQFKKFMGFMGKKTYSLFFIKEAILKKFKLYELYINSPHFPLLEKKIKSPLVLINNQRKLGGKFLVAPQTKNDDGLFNVTIFLHENKIDFLKSASLFLMGKYPKNDKKIIQFETDKLDLMSLNNEKLKFFGDGEIFEPQNEFSISIKPKALEVFTENDEMIICPEIEETIGELQ